MAKGSDVQRRRSLPLGDISPDIERMMNEIKQKYQKPPVTHEK